MEDPLTKGEKSAFEFHGCKPQLNTLAYQSEVLKSKRFTFVGRVILEGCWLKYFESFLKQEP